jgi:hypothetical protein
MTAKITLPALAVLAVALLIGISDGGRVAEAATVTVTNLNDSGAGSLRQAIADAAPGDTIEIKATGTITLTGGQLLILKDLTINGPGHESLVISGNNASRVFQVASATVSISGVTITGGNAGAGAGGGVNAQGTLTLKDSLVVSNVARLGGGIYNTDTLNLVRTAVINNSDTQTGGGFYIDGGTTTLTDSAVGGNTSVGLGGGFYVSTGTVNLVRSTVSGNSATRGGGFENRGTVNLTNSTLSGNNATTGDGGGVWMSTGNLVIANSTIAGNTAASGKGGGIFDFVASGTTSLVNTVLAGNSAGAAPDCSGSIASLGFNLIGSNSGCNYTSAAGDQVGTFASPINPLHGALAENGGPTRTHALLTGSPAIDAGNPTTPGSGGTACEATDQRGASRPQGSACDTGAYEFGGVVPTPTPAAVPGLSAPGLVAMALLLAAAFIWMQRRRPAPGTKPAG